MGYPAPKDTCTSRLLQLRLRVQPKGEGQKIVRARQTGKLLWLYLLEKQESFIHDTSTIWLPKQDLNKYNTRRHGNLKGEISLSPTLDKELHATNDYEEQENYSFPGMSALIS